VETYLDRILERTRVRVESTRRERPFEELDRETRNAGPARDFAGAIRAEGMSLIAEFKRRSPSKGVIRERVDPAEVAEAYERGGARALSVLTEPEFFSGSLDDLAKARQATTVPVLRKDFVVDPYQIAEARAGGADAVLLIVAAIPDPVLFAELADAAAHYNLAALVEVHSEWELDGAFEIAPELVGVNQRDLRTFDVDEGLAIRLRRRIPADVATVAESGIADRAGVAALEEAGVEAMLVGETLMRAGDPARAARELLGLSVPEGDPDLSVPQGDPDLAGEEEERD
jgi:indole-3-glycerol phosphate synthase